MRIELGYAGLHGLRLVADKLNKRARRHNMDELIVRVIRELPDDRFDVEIDGCAPCIDGWSLAARIEFNPVGTLVHVVPGPHKELDYSEYRTHTGYCDHCNSQRRRNDVFVLINSDGRRKVVGRNCLADFIRSGDAESFARYAELCEQLEEYEESELSELAYEEGFGSGRAIPTAPIEGFLRITAMIIRNEGWVSRSVAKETDGTATANNVSFYLYGRGKYCDAYRAELGEPTESDVMIAGKSLQWAQTVEPGTSEYLNTIGTIARAGFVGPGLDGYVASIISSYQRACDKIAERAARPDKKHIGTIGERLRDVSVRVVRVRYFEGNYGVKTIVAMEADVDGGVAPIVWFASGSKEFNEGADYIMTATVKKHDTGEYGEQTTVSRAKLA